MNPLNVVITGGAGQICYSLAFSIGDALKKPYNLHLLDIPGKEGVMEGVKMELEDAALPHLNDVIVTSDLAVGFKAADLAIFLGGLPRKEGQARKDLLEANAGIFVVQGQALAKYASPDVKVVVIANPCNTNCRVLMESAPNVPRQNFTAMTRLDHNRARSLIARTLKRPVTHVKNVVIWGNHSQTMYPDYKRCYVADHDDRKTPVGDLIRDSSDFKDVFIPKVAKRGDEIIKARGMSSAASAAKAIIDHVHDLFHGTAPGEYVSMAVASDGSYGVPKDLIFSFPCVCRNGKYEIVKDLSLDDFDRQMLTTTTKELESEWTTAQAKLLPLSTAKVMLSDKPEAVAAASV